ncbi:hypothetical protein KSP40_PGU004249 [Platanthera guangdongensis]|uniref:C2H2-type domain-containing protein n=1 Tax=Platanthera guangdongensis TaxID=2320717 RepID=A0ABR2LCE8_9ASPA
MLSNRYNEDDQPVCRVCNVTLKSESLLSAHLASRKHHEADIVVVAKVARKRFRLQTWMQGAMQRPVGTRDLHVLVVARKVILLASAAKEHPKRWMIRQWLNCEQFGHYLHAVVPTAFGSVVISARDKGIVCCDVTASSQCTEAFDAGPNVVTEDKERIHQAAVINDEVRSLQPGAEEEIPGIYCTEQRKCQLAIENIKAAGAARQTTPNSSHLGKQQNLQEPRVPFTLSDDFFDTQDAKKQKTGVFIYI